MSTMAPVKNTAGEGFTAEDAVVAWLSCHLLTGIPWLGSGVETIKAIECQMRQDGWFFDDIVLQLETDGIERRCACSVKSHPIFGKSGAPLDFARAVWQQWFSGTESSFQRGRDCLALVASQHEPEIREAWFGLTETARTASPETLARRCENETEPSALRRAAFKSLQIGDQPGAGPIETARLLQAFHLIEHDFQHSESQSVKTAIALCQQALTDAARERAGELWDALLIVATAVRRKGGSITLPDLLAKLAHRFPLKQHPHYASEWATILTESLQRMEVLPAKIGGTVAVDRPDLLNRVSREAEVHRQVAVLGESGNGKSVLARDWATANAGDAVWLRAGDLSVPGGLRGLFRLSHGIAELFTNACRPGRLVLDGLDKCFDEAAFDEAALILRATTSEESRDRWQTMLTCCPEDWERVHSHLIRRGITIPGEVVRIGRFTDPELQEALEKLPSLRLLAQRPHLHSILRWPKALDILATYWKVSDAPLQWATESDFANWFWQSAICQQQRGSLRDRVARKLAVQLADRMAASAQLDIFPPEEAVTLEELAREGHVEIDVTRGTGRFTHELIADWARQRELQVQGESASVFLQTRLHSPLWHRAVRFHGLALLEHQSEPEPWLRLFLRFHTGSAADEMAQNLLLEAPIFAINQKAVMERLWSVLESDEGKLLRRFLRQFIRVATIPDEEAFARFRSHGPDLQLQAAVQFRIPWPPYWPGVLAFLATHKEEAITLAPEQIADVNMLWLRLHGAISRGMKDAATIAVVAARRFYRSQDRWHGEDYRVSVEEKICQALLAAAPEMPDEVTELTLKLSGRRLPDPEDGFPEEIEVEDPLPFTRNYGPPRPWPEGPRRPCAGAFREAFMSGNHAEPFLRTLPDVATEVMFAVLLNIPREDWDPDDIQHEFDEHGFNANLHQRAACFWTSGPFLTFLRADPSTALRAIVRLVNFATDRGLELREDLRQQIAVPIKIDGEVRMWRGHQFSYLWHQGHVFGPRAVGCALLSLEKWFYMLLDENQPVDAYIETILRESNSIALAAVLICLGKRKPELFLGPLRPILEAIDFYWIEKVCRAQGGDFHASAFYDHSSVMREAWREWVQMPHRKEYLSDLALRMFLGNAKWREMIADFRVFWQARIDEATPENPASQWLPGIVSQFDLSNWHAEAREGGTLIIYQPPPDLPQPSVEASDALKRLELLSQLPYECSQALLEGSECSEQRMNELWSMLSEVRKLSTADEEVGLRDVEDALCGVVAVAVLRHRAWLAAMPAREAEAFEILHRVAANPPKRYWYVENDICDFKWDNFAAAATTALWSEQPNDPFLRHSVGSLAVWNRHLVVATVMRIAAQNRVRLGDNFEQLMAHAVGYAPVIHRARMEQHLPEKTFDVSAWTSGYIDNFVKCKTPPLPESWIELAQPQIRRGRNADHFTGGFDIGHINAALSWAEKMTEARDAAERRAWVNFHRQSLICALARIKEVPAPSADQHHWDGEQERFPYGDEQNLLERIARIVARLAPGEEHQLLWEPILSLGCAGSHWIDAFVGHWLIEAGGHDEPAPALIEQWLAMLAYAEGSPQWKADARRRSHDKMWNEILGFSTTGDSFWHEPLAPAVNAVRAFQERWARAHAQDEDDASTYIHFIKTPAARELRIDGLCLLHETVPIGNQYFWRHTDIRNAFASLLRLLLDEHWKEVIANPKAKEFFMAFALKLASLQHPLGSELLEIAGSRFGAI